ncbi:MAG: hypothetical protein IPI16_07755 [Comamonadaceae bacterium]|nr:hypothetical protein [Comamonadaceae bacterium]
MNLYAHARKWLLATGCLWVLVSAAAGAPAHPGAVVAVRAWTPPVGRDDLDSARAALQPDARGPAPGDRPGSAPRPASRSGTPWTWSRALRGCRACWN